MTGLRVKLLSSLKPETRTLLIDFLALRCSAAVKRTTEFFLDVPIPKALRNPPEAPLFIHIPKNAGVTITQQLYGRFTGHRTAEWYRAADKNFFDSKHKFAVVRNPIERFVSGYYFLLGGGSPDVPVSPRAVAKLKQFSNIIEFAAYYQAAGLEQLEQLDPVFHAQSNYIYDRQGKSLVDELLSLETISGKVIDVHGFRIDLRFATNQNPVLKDSAQRSELQERVCTFVQSIYKEDYKRIGFIQRTAC